MATQTAGAGRGKQGGPTAKQLADYERKQNAGIFTEGMPVGSASSRGDGIAQRGKTKGRLA